MEPDIKGIEEQFRPALKMRFAALQMLTEWLILGDILPTDPLLALRRHKHQTEGN